MTEHERKRMALARRGIWVNRERKVEKRTGMTDMSEKIAATIAAFSFTVVGFFVAWCIMSCIMALFGETP